MRVCPVSKYCLVANQANLNPEFMWPFFKNRSIPYNLRNGNILPPARSCQYGINSVQFQGRLLWNNLPTSVKQSVSVKEYKQKLNHVQKIRCCMSKILKFLSIMSVLVFVKLIFISLVTTVWPTLNKVVNK